MDDALRRAIAGMMMQSGGAAQIVPQQPLSPSFPNMQFGMDSGEYGGPQVRGGVSLPLGGNDLGVSGSYKSNGAAPEWSALARLTRQF